MDEYDDELSEEEMEEEPEQEITDILLPVSNEPKLATVKTTPPVLTKYERARLIAERAAELAKGYPSTIPKNQITSTQPEKIAEQELKLKIIPKEIRRDLPNKTYEIWKISEFKFIK